MLQDVAGGILHDFAIDAPIDAPFLVLCLSESAASVAEWDVRVVVELEAGRFTLGRFRTTAPAAGDPPSRVIGQAYCAGARAWMVTLLGPMGARAQVALTTGGHGAQAVGVVKVAH